MALKIQLAQLGSRLIRSASIPGGIRKIGSGNQQQEEGGLISWVFNSLTKFVSALTGKIWQILVGGVRVSWTAIWGAIVSATQFIYNFNFNITEEEIEQQLQSSLIALAGTAGGTLGNAFGWLACGVLPGAAIFAFNEPLGLYVLENVGEEALDELAANLANLIQLSFSSAARAAAYYLFLKIRKAYYGDKPISKKPWSIALAVEEKIESIDNLALRQFVEEFLEESGEACIEAGYAVAGSVDAWLAQQKMAQQSMLGTNRTVEIEFNRQA